MNIVSVYSLLMCEIDKSNYYESLINLMLKYKLIDENEFNSMKLDYINLLIFKVKKYTKGINSSVSIDTLKELSASIVYTLNTYLITNSLSNNIEMLKKNKVMAIYNNGLDIIKSKLDRALIKYALVCNTKVKASNYYYNSTILSIKYFFNKYNYSYFSTNKIITCDYNIIIDNRLLLGIDYITYFLECIYYENKICSKFNDIDLLLKKNNTNYKNILINICDSVITKALMLEYNNKEVYNLSTMTDINTFIIDYNNKVISDKLDIAYLRLKNKLKLDNNTNNYLDKCYKVIKSNVVATIKSINI